MSRVFQWVIAVALIAASSGVAWASKAPIATPEPASLTLLAGGIAGVVALKRFRRRK